MIGHDAVNFFTEQSTIKDLILNPFSYYEVSFYFQGSLFADNINVV